MNKIGRMLKTSKSYMMKWPNSKRSLIRPTKRYPTGTSTRCSRRSIRDMKTDKTLLKVSLIAMINKSLPTNRAINRTFKTCLMSFRRREMRELVIRQLKKKMTGNFTRCS